MSGFKFAGNALAEVELKAKRNASATRARILNAAQECFSQHGYGATGIRDVAAAAGVSYALLSRYFGSKAGLLEAALMESLEPTLFLVTNRSEFGINLANLIVQSEPTGLSTAIAVLAAGDPEARKVATRVVDARVIQPLAEWLGPPDARHRATAIAMLGAGFVTHLHLLPMIDKEAVSEAHHPLVQWLAESFQRVVDAPLVGR